MALFSFLKRKEKQTRSDASTTREERNGRARKEEEGVRPASISAAVELNPVTLIMALPHVTEKSHALASQGQYVFRVSEHATKHTVRHAVESRYRVHVTGISMAHLPSKPRRRGLTSGRKSGYKKAIVWLKEGETIEMM